MRLCDLNPHLRFASELFYAEKPKSVRVADYRLFYVTRGEAEVHIGGDVCLLRPDCLFYCPGGSRYTIFTPGGFSLISLNFDLTQRRNDLLFPLLPQTDPAAWDAAEDAFEQVEDSEMLGEYRLFENAAKLRPRIDQIVTGFSSGDRLGRAGSSAVLKLLLIEMHHFDSADIPPGIRQVRDYIQRHYAKKITNRELADLVGYHEYYLNRLFSAHMGMNLHQYLLNVRLKHAGFLLLNTNMDLQSIAEQTGFGSYPHFSGYFKQTYGYSPSQYRKHLRSGI